MRIRARCHWIQAPTLTRSYSKRAPQDCRACLRCSGWLVSFSTLLSWMRIAINTWYSSVVLLLKCLCSSNPCTFEFSVFWGFAGIEPTTSGLTFPRSDQQTNILHKQFDSIHVKDDASIPCLCQDSAQISLWCQRKTGHVVCVLLCFIKPIFGNRYVRSRGFIVSEPRETHPRSEIADVPTSPFPPWITWGVAVGSLSDVILIWRFNLPGICTESNPEFHGLEPVLITVPPRTHASRLHACVRGGAVISTGSRPWNSGFDYWEIKSSD